MPAQLKEGTKVYAINEIPTSYSFLRQAIPCGYLPVQQSCEGTGNTVLPLYSLVIGQYFIHTNMEEPQQNLCTSTVSHFTLCWPYNSFIVNVYLCRRLQRGVTCCCLITNTPQGRLPLLNMLGIGQHCHGLDIP